MPMAPADPLFLMWCAVNRITPSGRAAGPQQRVSAEQALRGVTIEAAYSLKLDNEVGTISPGKRANFTEFTDSPLAVDPMAIKDIAVWGTVTEGCAPPAPGAKWKAALQSPPSLRADATTSQQALHHALAVAHAFE